MQAGRSREKDEREVPRGALLADELIVILWKNKSRATEEAPSPVIAKPFTLYVKGLFFQCS